MEKDAYECPAGRWRPYHYTNEQDGKTVRNYWTNDCVTCVIKHWCCTGNERRIKRWELESILERVQKRLDGTVEHPFGTIKAWMGATHFKMKTLRHIATEMALHVFAYNMTRVIAILGVPGLLNTMKG